MKIMLNIGGMSCGHCIKHVTEALLEITGVSSAETDLKTSSAVVIVSEEIPEAVFRTALDEAGYTLSEMNTVME